MAKERFKRVDNIIKKKTTAGRKWVWAVYGMTLLATSCVKPSRHSFFYDEVGAQEIYTRTAAIQEITEIRVYISLPSMGMDTKTLLDDLMLRDPSWKTSQQEVIREFVNDLTTKLPNSDSLIASSKVVGTTYTILLRKGSSKDLVCFKVFAPRTPTGILTVAVFGQSTFGYCNDRVQRWLERFTQQGDGESTRR